MQGASATGLLATSTDRIWQSVNFTSTANYQMPTAYREQGPCFSFLWLRYIVPQTWWLKTTENYSVEVLQARSLKSRWRVYISSGSSRGKFSFVTSVLSAASIPWLVALWLHHSQICLCGHITSSSSVCQISPAYFLQRCVTLALVDCMDVPGRSLHLEILNETTSVKITFSE